MRAFQSALAAISAIAVVNGQYYSSYGSSGLSYGSGLSGLYGSSYAPAISYGARYSTVSASPALSYGGGYSTISSAPAVSYSNSIVSSAAPVISSVAAAPVSYAVATPAVTSRIATVSAAPAVSYAAAPAVSYAAAPAVSYAAAPAVSYAAAAPAVSYASAAPVNLGVIATGGAATVRSHEIHTGSGNTAIRIEDSQAGDQVIRVHEGPQEGPQVAQVQVPGEQHHVRVINHQSGPAQVERVVSRAPTQVVDVQKPGRPGARIIQVVKGQSPAPSIEFVNAGGDSHHVYYADDVNAGGAIGGGIIGGGGVIGGGVVRTSYAAPSYGGAVISAAPAISTIGSRTISVAAAPAISTIGSRTISVAAAPAIRTIAAAPAISTISAAPAISYGTVSAAPAVSYGISAAPAISYGTVSSAPSISYGLGGFHYGGLGYSTGYSPYYNSGSNVFLDAKKKSSAKKSA